MKFLHNIQSLLTEVKGLKLRELADLVDHIASDQVKTVVFEYFHGNIITFDHFQVLFSACLEYFLNLKDGPLLCLLQLHQLILVYLLYFCNEFFHFVLFLHYFQSVLGFEIFNLYKILITIFMAETAAAVDADSCIGVAFEVHR